MYTWDTKNIHWPDFKEHEYPVLHIDYFPIDGSMAHSYKISVVDSDVERIQKIADIICDSLNVAIKSGRLK